MCFLSKPYHLGFGVDGQTTKADPVSRDQGVSDIGDSGGIHEPLVGAGAEVQSSVTHVPDDSLIAILSDPDTSPLSLLEDTA
jgi:hypothetical protein